MERVVGRVKKKMSGEKDDRREESSLYISTKVRMSLFFSLSFFPSFFVFFKKTMIDR